MSAPRPTGRPMTADQRLDREMDEWSGRRWNTPTLVFGVVISLLLGAIAALLALPDDAPATDDLALRRAVVQTAVTNEELRAMITGLQADVAARDARIAELEAAAAGDPAAAATAADERQSALDVRESALADREAALDAREAAVAAAEAGSTAGVPLQDLEGLDLDGLDGLDLDGLDLDGLDLDGLDLGDGLEGIELPQISEEEARGVFDRLIDRLRGIAGIEVPAQ